MTVICQEFIAESDNEEEDRQNIADDDSKATAFRSVAVHGWPGCFGAFGTDFK